MAQVGLHAYIALSMKNKAPKKKWFLFSFLAGSIIPDLDTIFTYIFSFLISPNSSMNIFHRTFTHNIFLPITLYLLFLIIYEITNNKKILYFGNGITLGIIFHLFLDIFLWFDSIHLFWPLPTNRLNMWPNFTPSYFVSSILMIFEFVFFRLLAWELIKIIIESPKKNGGYIHFLNNYMKIQNILILLFTISLLIFDDKIIYYSFYSIYIPSLIMIIYYIYNVRDSINEYSLLGKSNITIEKSPKRTPIDNIQ